MAASGTLDQTSNRVVWIDSASLRGSTARLTNVYSYQRMIRCLAHVTRPNLVKNLGLDAPN